MQTGAERRRIGARAGQANHLAVAALGERDGRPGGPGEGQRPLRGQLERDLAIEPVRLHFLFSFSLAGSLAGHGSERCTTPAITGNRRRFRFHFICAILCEASRLLEALFHRSAADEVAPA